MIKSQREMTIQGVNYRVVHYIRPRELASIKGTVAVFAYRRHAGRFWKWVRVPKGWVAYNAAIAEDARLAAAGVNGLLL